ncbi:hypothetical protein EMIT0196P_60231 [Pseudomonas chlororaphis]
MADGNMRGHVRPSQGGVEAAMGRAATGSKIKRPAQRPLVDSCQRIAQSCEPGWTTSSPDLAAEKNHNVVSSK